MTTPFYGMLFHTDFERFAELSRTEIIIYSCVIAHGGKTRTFIGSHRKIAELCGISIPSVKRAMKKFEDNEWMASSTYYQVKQYTMLQTQQNADLDHNSDPHLDHNSDLPTKCKVDHNSDLPLDHSDDLPLDQNSDLHVIMNNKEEKHLHDMADMPQTDDEKIFFNLVARWKKLLNWKESPQSLLGEWRQVVLDNTEVDVGLELQVIDSWLMMQHYSKTGRAWRIGWFDAIRRWIERENAQGGRKSLALNKVQRYYLNFAITAETIEYPPIDEENHVQEITSHNGTDEISAAANRLDVDSDDDSEDVWDEEFILRGVHGNILKMFGGRDAYVQAQRVSLIELWEREGYDVSDYRSEIGLAKA